MPTDVLDQQQLICMRYTILLLALPLGLQLNAQSFPFPDSATTWVQYFEVMVTQPPMPIFELASTTNLCMDGSDTLIAGTSYTRLSYCNAGYVGGTRSVDEAVYFFPADSTQEYLLYDFGAQVGDTVHDVFVNEGLAYSYAPIPAVLLNYRVDQVGQVEGRKWVLLQQLWGGPEQYWIEGFGSPYGLFSQQSPMNVSGYRAGIACMSHKDSIWYFSEWEITGMPGTCTPQYLGVEELLSSPIKLYPNPTTGCVRAEGFGAGAVLQVNDTMGRAVNVRKSSVSSTSIDLDLSHLPPGVYHVSIRGSAGSTRVIRM